MSLANFPANDREHKKYIRRNWGTGSLHNYTELQNSRIKAVWVLIHQGLKSLNETFLVNWDLVYHSNLLWYILILVCQYSCASGKVSQNIPNTTNRTTAILQFKYYKYFFGKSYFV